MRYLLRRCRYIVAIFTCLFFLSVYIRKQEILGTDVSLPYNLTTVTMKNSTQRTTIELEFMEISEWYDLRKYTNASFTLSDAVIVKSFDDVTDFYIIGGNDMNFNRSSRLIQQLRIEDTRGQWVELANVSIPSHLATTHMAASVYKNRLYIFTGQLDYECSRATDASAYLDLSTNEWTNLPAVPEARYAPQLAIVDDRVHLFGGAKPNRSSPAFDYWILDLNNVDRGWTNGPSLPESGDHGNAQVIDGWIYFFAFKHDYSLSVSKRQEIAGPVQPIGCKTEAIAQSGVLKIDAQRNSSSTEWTRVARLPMPVTYAGSVVIKNRYILLIGQISQNDNQNISYVQLFDVNSNQWVTLHPIFQKIKDPVLWYDEEESSIYMHNCSTEEKRCRIEVSHIIWSHTPRAEPCQFYTHYNCTTRKLHGSSNSNDSSENESRWNRYFSHIYLLNMPKAVQRLRKAWNQLHRVGLTSITRFDGFQIQSIDDKPALIDPELLWPEKMKRLKKNNDSEGILHFIRSTISMKFMYMNMWTRLSENSTDKRPVLIMEDDLQYILEAEETINIVETTMRYLRKYKQIKWDILYLAYRNIEATLRYRVSKKPGVYLWRTSWSLSNTAFIINRDPNSIKRLNHCSLSTLTEGDQCLSYCLKHQLIRGYLIQPKLVRALPGFSFALNQQQNYFETDRRHSLGRRVHRATFQK